MYTIEIYLTEIYLTEKGEGKYAGTNARCIPQDKDISQLPYIPIYIRHQLQTILNSAPAPKVLYTAIFRQYAAKNSS